MVRPLVAVLYCYSASWTVLTLFVVKGCTFYRICGIMVSVLYVVFYVVIFALLRRGIYFKSVLGPIWGLFPNKKYRGLGVSRYPCIVVIGPV